MKKILLIIAIIFVLIAAIIFFQNVIRGNAAFFTKTAQLTVNDTRINLEIADTPEKRQLGLSNRESLPENSGMIFIFDKPDYYPFWMKDMQIPLDIIFINGTRVVTVHPNVPPPAAGENSLQMYKPDEPADRVIELNAGKAQEFNIQKGKDLDIAL